MHRSCPPSVLSCYQIVCQYSTGCEYFLQCIWMNILKGKEHIRLLQGTFSRQCYERMQVGRHRPWTSSFSLARLTILGVLRKSGTTVAVTPTDFYRWVSPVPRARQHPRFRIHDPRGQLQLVHSLGWSNHLCHSGGHRGDSNQTLACLRRQCLEPRCCYASQDVESRGS